jgi:hypothetical protein
MRRSPQRLLFTALTALACACSSAGVGEPGPLPGASSTAQTAAAAEPDTILRLVLRLTDGGVEVVGAKRAPGKINRRDSYRSSSTFFRALDGEGRLLLERGFRLETEIRSETADEDGAIHGAHVAIDEPVFTVVVPAYTELDAIRFFRAPPGMPRANAVLIGEIKP